MHARYVCLIAMLVARCLSIKLCVTVAIKDTAIAWSHAIEVNVCTVCTR
jgi:hypothetical protein